MAHRQGEAPHYALGGYQELLTLPLWLIDQLLKLLQDQEKETIIGETETREV